MESRGQPGPRHYPLLRHCQPYDHPVTYVPLISLLLALLTGCLAFFYWWANRRHTQLRYDISAKSAFKATPAAQIEIGGRVVEDPYEVTLWLHPKGVKDIKSSDFDASKPVTLELSKPLITKPDPSEQEFKVSGGPGESKIGISPQLLKCGKLLYVTAIVDGKPDLKVSGGIADVDLVEFAVADAGMTDRAVASKKLQWATGVILAVLAVISGYGYYMGQQARQLSEETYNQVMKDSAEARKQLGELPPACLPFDLPTLQPFPTP